jgi:CheY-like chemotaxis protein
MKRILFLDDNKERHRAVKPHFLHDEAYTTSDAIALLQKHNYDIVFLDHDLEGKEMLAPANDLLTEYKAEETGFTVVKWIVANKPVIPLIVVHSLNPAGAESMVSLLRHFNYNVIQRGFLQLKETLNEFVD